MIFRSKLSSVHIPLDPLHVHVFRRFREFPNNPALVDGITGLTYTFSDVERLTKNLAQGLLDLGVKKGDMFLIYSTNNVQFPLMAFAAMAVGATVTTINPAYTIREVEHQLSDSHPSYIYTIPECLSISKKVAAKIGGVKKIILLGHDPDCVSFDTLFNADGKKFNFSQIPFDVKKDVALLPYSSGTTGLPKGVMLTHYGMVSNICQTAHPGLISHQSVITPENQEAVIAVLPFFHGYGLVIVMCLFMHLGYALVTVPNFTPESFLGAIAEHKVTFLPIVPPLITFLTKSPLVKDYNLSHVKTIVCGAAPLSKECQDEFNVRMKELKNNIDCIQAYGMTELSVVGSYTPVGGGKVGSSGWIVPNTDVKILDVSNGRQLGVGEAGEICFKGPQVMLGYFLNDGATRNTITTDGWMYSGDIGYIDDDGYLFVVDRLKELIKCKGFQVAPAELEGLLLTHPGVADAGVIGIADPRSGEVPKAFIVPKPGKRVTARDLQDFVKENTAQYKWLEGGVQFVKEIPKTASGKILRKELRLREKQSKL